MGLGKQQEDDFYTAADNVQRRQLEVELQAEEGSDRRTKREVGPPGAAARAPCAGTTHDGPLAACSDRVGARPVRERSFAVLCEGVLCLV